MNLEYDDLALIRSFDVMFPKVLNHIRMRLHDIDHD